MIKHIQIKDYKCLHDENLEIKPFTIVTGVNSAGKSSLIQSVLLPVRRIGKNGQILLDTIVNLTFDTIRNKYYNAKSVRVISISIMCIFPITEQMNSLWFFFLRKRMPACRST